MATRTTRTLGYVLPATSQARQGKHEPRQRPFIQGLQEDNHLARSMANARRLRGENVSNLSDEEFLARVAASARS
ncbi:hypothetical protein [Belnapia rosea]|uniref:Uncharacterized protein n=1 Tax=Belnapia rosea TaxID=938405 RepID=A0A1G7BZ76_9PROT|nr:hypothetical protein [Belnapia rosea]SDE32404.1 hypothetical protein SAMN04487779_102825 [Belnapia rosea]